MNCREFTEFIIEYVEGDLAGETRDETLARDAEHQRDAKAEIQAQPTQDVKIVLDCLTETDTGIDHELSRIEAGSAPLGDGHGEVLLRPQPAGAVRHGDPVAEVAGAVGAATVVGGAEEEAQAALRHLGGDRRVALVDLALASELKARYAPSTGAVVDDSMYVLVAER